MDNRVSFRLGEETARQHRAEARQRNTTMTAIIKEAIRKEWKRLPKQPVDLRANVKPNH
jgi:hypothetical protein